METYQKDFLNRYSGYAQEVQKEYGIPASVTLAQAINESGWGLSTLANLFYNFFGIKGKGDAGTVYLPTWEEVNGEMVSTIAGFAQYTGVESSFFDYGDFLKRNGRYAAAFTAGDPYATVDAIASAGYATDSGYADKVKSIITDYNLTSYDAKGSDPAKIIFDPSTLNRGRYPGDNTVTGSVFGRVGDTSHQDAIDRANAIDPPTTIIRDLTNAAGQDIKNFMTSGLQSAMKLGIIVVLVIVLLVIIIQALPIPQVQAAKAIIGGE